MELVAGMLAFGVVLAIAAVLVIREAGRIARRPPPALFDDADAYEWVVEHVSDEVAATLTPDDVRRILDFQIEFLERKGASAGNGESAATSGPVVIGDAEAVAYIVTRSAETGEVYLPEQVYAVVETQLAYLRSIGAIGPRAEPTGSDDPETHPET